MMHSRTLQNSRVVSQQAIGPSVVSVPDWGETGRNILRQTLLCSIPVTLLLAFGRVTLAGACFWALFPLMLVRLVFLRRPDEFVCLVIALAPWVNLLRDFLFYSSVIVLYAFSAIYYNQCYNGRVRRVLGDSPETLAVLIYVSLYYLLSVLNTGSYESNIKMLQLPLSMMLFLSIGGSRTLVASALVGVAVSSIGFGLGMLPLLETGGGRLGMIVVDGHTLGNPVSLGAPLAYSLLAIVGDGGEWLMVARKRLFRIVLLAATVILLGLTTSRTGWLMAAAGMSILLVFDRKARIPVLVVVAIVAVTLQVLLSSPLGDGVQKAIDRTFGEDRTTVGRSSGRSDQWKVAYNAVNNSSVETLFLGEGPGRGATVYARLSALDPEVRYAAGEPAQWHSLFLQVVIELGLVGLLPLLAWFLAILILLIKAMSKIRRFLPLVSLIACLVVNLTVVGNSTVDGMFLGITLLPIVWARQRGRDRRLSSISFKKNVTTKDDALAF
jgi:O-antigen ligase